MKNIILDSSIPVSNTVADTFRFLSNEGTELDYLVNEIDYDPFILAVIGIEVNLQEWTESYMLV